MRYSNNNDIYESFDRLRALTEADMINNMNNEAQNGNNETPDAVPYTSQDTLMTNTLESAKQEFGADFNKIKNPMLYFPADGDITLSGIIPEMNDAKFQFRYKVGDGAGCYVWSNPYLPISDKTIQLLSKVNGVCKNWRDEISKSEDCKPSNYRDPEDQQQNQQGQATQGGTEGGEEAGGEDEQAPQGMNEDVYFFRKTMNKLSEAANPTRQYVPGDDIEESVGFRAGDDMELIGGQDIFNWNRRING